MPITDPATRPISAIDAIDAASAKMLRLAGVTTTAQLLERGATKTARLQLASDTGIGLQLIIDWVHRADLMRVPGVDGGAADVLRRAEVASVVDLARADAARLYARCSVVCRREEVPWPEPGRDAVVAWVAHAGTLDPIVQY
ncbi:MAG: DUF4332 domain-containing protein [Acidimicrobiales bacterium]